jgi:hypothetical protein
LLKEPVHISIDLRGYAIDFHPVARGEEDDFSQVPPYLEPAAVAAQPRGMHRELLAQFNRRGLIAQSGNKEFHEVAGLEGWTIAAAHPAREVWPNLAIWFTNLRRQFSITQLA